VGRAAEILNISHLLDALPKALSGGERQRVAIGRAIVRKPKFFLFDEPLSNLDAALRVQLRIELIRLHQELGATMIYVTHDQVEAMTMGDRISILRKGRLEQLGSPMDLYRAPVNTFVAGFLGSPAVNLMSCEYRDGMLRIAGQYDLPCPQHIHQYAHNIVKVGFRPEDVDLAVDAGISSTVVVSENLGDQCIVHSKIIGHDKLFTAKISGWSQIPSKGQELRLMPNLSKALFFDKNDQAIY
jgi:multiple sugar transport system ATP-binding protein